MKEITIEQFVAHPLIANCKLKVIGGKAGLSKKITSHDINRPGLALAGYFEVFGFNRIQIFGRGEIYYINSLPPQRCKEVLGEMFDYKIPCCIVTGNQKIPDILKELSEKNNIALLQTPLSTGKFCVQITLSLEKIFAPHLRIHGTLLDVYGVGVLILGESGIGKSECALELIERGHLLIGDDAIEIRKEGDILIGTGIKRIKHHIEIRGVGIIDVKLLFGVKSICDYKEIELAVKLEMWQEDKEYERLGLEPPMEDILEVPIPHLTIPIRPGRNIAVIIEVAAIDYHLKKVGYHSAKELDAKLIQEFRGKR